MIDPTATTPAVVLPGDLLPDGYFDEDDEPSALVRWGVFVFGVIVASVVAGPLAWPPALWVLAGL